MVRARHIKTLSALSNNALFSEDQLAGGITRLRRASGKASGIFTTTTTGACHAQSGVPTTLLSLQLPPLLKRPGLRLTRRDKMQPNRNGSTPRKPTSFDI